MAQPKAEITGAYCTLVYSRRLWDFWKICARPERGRCALRTAHEVFNDACKCCQQRAAECAAGSAQDENLRACSAVPADAEAYEHPSANNSAQQSNSGIVCGAKIKGWERSADKNASGNAGNQLEE